MCLHGHICNFVVAVSAPIDFLLCGSAGGPFLLHGAPLAAQAVGPSVNQVITLTSATGFHAAAKRPPAGLPSAEHYSRPALALR